jgi:hypothetical protein
MPEPTPEPPVRHAIVIANDLNLLDVASAYLPGNYKVVGELDLDEHYYTVLIEGRDSAGWTLEDYVIPRLMSGLMGCREVTIPFEP